MNCVVRAARMRTKAEGAVYVTVNFLPVHQQDSVTCYLHPGVSASEGLLFSGQHGAPAGHAEREEPHEHERERERPVTDVNKHGVRENIQFVVGLQ
ncbi:hypothetical protein MHYP_G00142590 [Metynnis hypsauchen]